MKNTLFLFIAFVCLSFTVDQPETEIATLAKTDQMPVSILVSTCVFGKQSLFLMNPRSTDASFYEKPWYNVKWHRGHVILGEGCAMECAEDGLYEVIITNLKNGRQARTNITLATQESN